MADQERQDRINRGMTPISREMHVDRLAIRTLITTVLAFNCMIAEASMHEREQRQIESLRMATRIKEPAYTFSSFSSGGCLDAIASMACGLAPLWGTEICEKKRRMWSHLTSTPDMGDTYQQDWKDTPVPDILWSGQVCVDYSLSGPRTGSNGKTGWMFLAQKYPILQMQPNAVIIEMVANVVNIHDGMELRHLKESIGDKYHVHQKVIRVWDHADESNRERLILVCLHKRIGEHARTYQFPRPDTSTERTARDIADPDHLVPRHLWRRVQQVNPFMRTDHPKPGKLYKLAQMGPGMGHSSKPNSVYSWDGTMNTGTTHNGGGVRPPLDWHPGQPIDRVRKTTVNEARKMANLPESYIEWMRQFDKDDKFAYECINMGVPLGTAIAINKSVIDMLELANMPKTEPQEYGHMRMRSYESRMRQSTPKSIQQHDCHNADLGDERAEGKHMRAFHSQQDHDDMRKNIGNHSLVQSMQVDTGTDATLIPTSMNRFLKRARDSAVRILVADKAASMPVDLEGDLPCTILNVDGHDGIEETVEFTVPALTVERVRRSLFSIESYYRDKGFEIFMRQPLNGPSEITNMHTGGDTRIPIRYDKTKGGFWIDYIPTEAVESVPQRQRQQWLQDQITAERHRHDINTVRPEEQHAYDTQSYDGDVAAAVHQRCSCHSAVKEVIISKTVTDKMGKQTVELTKQQSDPPIYAQHPYERQIRGVKSQLRDKKNKQQLQQFHEDHGHMGFVAGCKVCRMVKGTMRRIYKVYDPYKPNLPGYAWDMDICTVSDRSIEQYKYMIVLRCRSTGYVKLLPLKGREASDLWGPVEAWIRTLRKDPIYNRYSYKPVQHILTDREGSWREDCAEWQERIVRRLGVTMEYISPDRHEQAGRAERAVGIVENATKSLLMQNQLSPDWWWRAAEDAEYLLNRFPVMAASHGLPLDGDRARPLELFTDGQYSRKQINRELSYYVPVGTPCLVHDTSVIGSSITPKVRWGIAAGMQREVVRFMCPYTRRLRHSKSYIAYKLQEGLSYTQFLGLPPQQTSRRSLQLAQDKLDAPTLQIPADWPTSRELDKFAQTHKIHTQTIPDLYADKGTADMPAPPPITHTILDQTEQKYDEDDTDPEQLQRIINDTIDKDVTLTETEQSAVPNKEFGGQRVQGEVPGPRVGQGTSKGSTEQNAVTDDREIDATKRGNTTLHTPPARQLADGSLPHGLEGDVSDGYTTKNGDEPTAAQPERLHHESTDRQSGEPSSEQGGELGGLATGSPSEINRVGNPSLKRGAHGGMQGLEAEASPYQGTPTVTEGAGGALYTNTETGELQSKPMQATSAEFEDWDRSMISFVDIDIDAAMFEKAETAQMRRETVVSKDGERWQDVVKQFKPPLDPSLIEVYRDWLVDDSPDASEWDRDMFPIERGRCLKGGLHFIPPAGVNWQAMVEEHTNKLRGTSSKELKNLVRSSLAMTIKWIRSMKNIPAYQASKKRESTVSDGLRKCPKNLQEALRGPDKDGWQEAAALEFDTLSKMGVFDHGYTLKEVKAVGIRKEPINISVALTNKYHDGVFERHKVRMAVAGHKYNMTKGIDYDDVFAAAPNQNTVRLLSAMTVQMGLHRKSWDIKLAYCWAELPSEQMVALKYPKGYERYRDLSHGRKEPEYIILRRNCYGLPAAGKHWADHRDKHMMKRWNQQDDQGNTLYTCKKCVYDPAMFYITKGPKLRADEKCTMHLRPYEAEAWVSIHTDDCDAYSTSKQMLEDLYKDHNTTWKAKVTSSEFMLGIKRKRNTLLDAKNNIVDDEIHVTMIPYTEGMYNAFKDHISEKHAPKTPFPTGLALSKHTNIDPAESAKVLDRGYMRAIGMILWATRGCYPECAQGIGQLASLMAKPSEEAWKAAMHMIKWMYDNRARGIRFSKHSPNIPIVFSDASNKPDPNDGLSRYGYFLQMAGGPVAYGSKKLAHVGLSAFHNEYMALRHAASVTVWAYNILREIGMQHMVAEPIRVYGDNLAANKLTKDHFIGSGNQYIYLPYFWTQELVKNKIITVPHVSTKHNIADLHTKSVDPVTVRTLVGKACGLEPDWLHAMYDGGASAVAQLCEVFNKVHTCHWCCSTTPEKSVQ